MALTFIGSGLVPQRTDTRWRLLVKKLAAIQANLGANASSSNDPQRTDTIYGLRMKTQKALKGIGPATSTVSITGAGTSSANQQFTRQANGSWVSADTNLTIQFVVGDNSWEMLDAFSVVLYASAPSVFPTDWTVQNGSAPAPTGRYV